MNERVQPFTARLFFGALLVGLGLLWTLDNLGLADAGEVLRWWPALLIAYGVAKLTGLGYERRTTPGVVALVAGVLLLSGNLGWRLGLGLLWPLALIALGVQILRRGGVPNDTRGAVGHSGERIRTFALMGGSSTRSLSQSFRSAELSAFMGGVELDLREAKPADGRAVVDVFAFMGGVDIIVPPEWRLEMEAAPIMGAIQDERTLATDLAPGSLLVVRGAVILGGLVLRSAPADRPQVRVGVISRRGRTVVANMRVGGAEVRFGRADEGAPAPPAPPASAPSPPPDEPR